MAEAEKAAKVARVLNYSFRCGRDLMAAGDGAVLTDFVGDYMVEEGSETHPPDSKSTDQHEYS